MSCRRAKLGAERVWFLPTLLWFSASDVALQTLCAAGTLSALLAVAGLAPAGTLAGAWLGYLSLSTIGQDFLRFQWDGLLLEAGVVAVLLAPWRWRSRLSDDSPPSRTALWLAR